MPSITHSKAADLLSKVGVKCNAGEDIEVDKIVRLRGVISKGTDYESAATVKALSLATLGCFARHCGITREAAISAAIAAVRENMSTPCEGEEESEEKQADPRDEAFAEEIRKRIAAELPAIKCKGKRTGGLLVLDLTQGAAVREQYSVTLDKVPA